MHSQLCVRQLNQRSAPHSLMEYQIFHVRCLHASCVALQGTPGTDGMNGLDGMLLRTLHLYEDSLRALVRRNV